MKQLLYRLLGDKYTWLAKNYRQVQTYCYSVLHPYRYDAEQYADTFLEQPCEFAYTSDIEKHIDNGLLADLNGRLALTERGLDLSNSVMSDFLK